MYLLHSSAHSTHCTKVIPFGVATRIRRNCSAEQKFEQRSSILEIRKSQDLASREENLSIKNCEVYIET